MTVYKVREEMAEGKLVKREDTVNKCPKFDGNKDEYQEWRGKVED